MSATTQYTTFSDLYDGLLKALRKTTGVTATENESKRAINTALQDMHIGFGEKFPWAERRARLITQPEYTTGTVSINKGSTTLTGTGTAWNTANDFSVNNARAGGKLRLAGGSEVYEVSAVGSDTSITLTSAFTQDDISGESYVYFEDAYALASDFLRPLDLYQFSDGHEIPIISRTDFRRRFTRNYLTGRPKVCSIFEFGFSGDTSPVRKVVFYRPPDKAYTIPYYYVTSQLAIDSSGNGQTALSADDDEPIVPLRYRHLIILHALYNKYRDSKNDNRSAEVKAEYEQLISRIAGDQEIGAKRPSFSPNRSMYTLRARRPY